MRVRIAFAAAALISLAGAVPATAQVDVTTCGQNVGPGQVATLQADLDCSATTGVGLVLETGVTLVLNGFDVIGNPAAPFGTHGVVCHGTCTVVGPGAIRDFASDGMFVEDAVRIRGATIRNNGFRGIEGDGFTHMRVDDAVFFGNGGEALYTGGGVRVANTVFDHDGAGILGYGVRVEDSTFTNNGNGVTSDGKTIIKRCVFSGNNIAMQLYKGSVKDCTVENNYQGIGTTTVVVRHSTVRNNDANGIDLVTAVVRDSVVTGNGSACTDPRFPCADIDTREQPKVSNTVCEHSLSWQNHTPWGVCSLD